VNDQSTVSNVQSFPRITSKCVQKSRALSHLYQSAKFRHRILTIFVDEKSWQTYWIPQIINWTDEFLWRLKFQSYHYFSLLIFVIPSKLTHTREPYLRLPKKSHRTNIARLRDRYQQYSTTRAHKACRYCCDSDNQEGLLEITKRRYA
jgi:hypothetical protein